MFRPVVGSGGVATAGAVKGERFAGFGATGSGGAAVTGAVNGVKLAALGTVGSAATGALKGDRFAGWWATGSGARASAPSVRPFTGVTLPTGRASREAHTSASRMYGAPG